MSKAHAPPKVDAATAAILANGVLRRQAAAALAATVVAQVESVTTPALSASDRENPEKLSGDDLRTLAHRRGVSRSEAANLTDDRLRMQLRYITYRQYTEAD